MTSIRSLRTEGNQLWVGPNGDDNYNGSQDSPLATIQEAIRRFKKDFSESDFKEVLLKPGTYQEDVLVNTRNVAIRGHGDVTIKGAGSRPTIFVTNMDESGADAYYSGVGYSYNEGGGTFTYDGDSTDRSIRSSLSHDDPGFGFYLEGVTVQQNTSPHTLVVLPSEDGNSESVIGDVHLEACDLEGDVRFKNTKTLSLREAAIDQGSSTVLDNCSLVTVPGDVDSGTHLGALIARYRDSGLEPEEVQAKGVSSTSFFNTLDGVWRYVHLYCHGSNVLGHAGQGMSIKAAQKDQSNNGVVFDGSGDVGDPSSPSTFVDVINSEHPVQIKNRKVAVERVDAPSATFVNSGRGIFRNVYFSSSIALGGSPVDIYGGVVEGTVTVFGSNANLYNLNITNNLEPNNSAVVNLYEGYVGNMVQTQSGSCTANLKGCYIEGDLDANTNGGTIDCDGGEVHGTNVNTAADVSTITKI